MEITIINKQELENILSNHLTKIIKKLNDLSVSQVNTQSEKLLTRKEAAQMLQISLPTLHQYTKSGIIKSKRIGNSVRYSLEDLKASVVVRRFRKGGMNE